MKQICKDNGDIVMMTFARVKGKNGLTVVNYNNQSALISWNSIKGVREDSFKQKIEEIILCLLDKTSLAAVMDYMKPHNLVTILATYFREETETYLRWFIIKQFNELKTTTANMVFSEVFGRSIELCFADREPLVLELVNKTEVLISEVYDNHPDSGFVKYCGKEKGYHSIQFKGNDISISSDYLAKKGIPQDEAIRLLAQVIVGLQERLINFERLYCYSEILGPTSLIGLMFSLYQEEAIKYFRHFAEGFSIRRERINTSRLLRDAIDPKIQDSNRYLHRTLADHIRPTIESIVNEEYSRQCIVFPQSNLKEMTLDKTRWEYYNVEGPTLNCTRYDFSSISEEGIRREYMLYLRNAQSTSIDPLGTGKYSTPIIGIAALLEINPSIKRFSQIKKTDVRLLKIYLQTSVKAKRNNKPLSVSTISRIFIYLRDIVTFLTEYYSSLAKKDKKYQQYIPKHNYFRDFRMPNVDKMANNTISIPDVVMDEISKYKHEISETYVLMFDIFNWTGLRAKEVELLEEGCVQYDQEIDFWYLTANSPKTEKIRRKKALPLKRIVAVPQSIAKRIIAQEEVTEHIRDKYSTPYIFVKESVGLGHEYAIIRAADMMRALNKIVKKHNITDENNNVWNFTTKQSRKTFAVKLISNGASIEEVATALGHLWLETTAAYYAEIERMKVADMNTEFFQRKFEIIFGEEQLARFNEQERKQLYLDFCLDFRQVELGVCSRHISQGICDKAECATCNCLCTGHDYLNQWLKMRDQQQQQLDILLNIYTAKGYENYEMFPEFKRVLHLRNSYQDVIDKITGTVRKNNE